MGDRLDEAVGQVLLAIANKLDMNNQRDFLWLRAVLADVISQELEPFFSGTGTVTYAGKVGPMPCEVDEA